MTIRSHKKTRSEVSLQDPIGVDKEGNELPSTVYLHAEGNFGYSVKENSSFL